MFNITLPLLLFSLNWLYVTSLTLVSWFSLGYLEKNKAEHVLVVYFPYQQRASRLQNLQLVTETFIDLPLSSSRDVKLVCLKNQVC